MRVCVCVHCVCVYAYVSVCVCVSNTHLVPDGKVACLGPESSQEHLDRL